MFSWPLFFHEMTVAPYSMTSTESPLGRLAVTFLPSEWTVGWGPVVLGERAEGLCALSTMIAVFVLLILEMSKGNTVLKLLLMEGFSSNLFASSEACLALLPTHGIMSAQNVCSSTSAPCTDLVRGQFSPHLSLIQSGVCRHCGSVCGPSAEYGGHEGAL